MKNLGATHLLGEATDSMVSLAAAKGMKVVKAGAISLPRTFEECLPHCNPGELNDYTNNLVQISSNCPKYLERFSDGGYKTDFEVEIDSQTMISNNTGYGFRRRVNVSDEEDGQFVSRVSDSSNAPPPIY